MAIDQECENKPPLAWIIMTTFATLSTTSFTYSSSDRVTPFCLLVSEDLQGAVH